MIEAKNLRIENLVYSNKQVVNIVQLERLYGDNYRMNDVRNNPNIEPIPLFKELIQNIPRIKEIATDHYHLEITLQYPGKRFIEITKTQHRWVAYYIVNDVAASSVKYYIHELQNLYKEITGIELEINQ